MAHPGFPPGRQEVPGLGAEELLCLAGIGRGRVGDVDDRRHPAQRPVESHRCYQVDSRRPGDDDRLVAGVAQRRHQVAANQARAHRYRNAHRRLPTLLRFSKQA